MKFSPQPQSAGFTRSKHLSRLRHSRTPAPTEDLLVTMRDGVAYKRYKVYMETKSAEKNVNIFPSNEQHSSVIVAS